MLISFVSNDKFRWNVTKGVFAWKQKKIKCSRLLGLKAVVRIPDTYMAKKEEKIISLFHIPTSQYQHHKYKRHYTGTSSIILVSYHHHHPVKTTVVIPAHHSRNICTIIPVIVIPSYQLHHYTIVVLLVSSCHHHYHTSSISQVGRQAGR